MTALVVAEHNNQELKPVTLNTVTAALELDQDIHILIAGNGCSVVAEEAAKISGVAKVLLVESDAYENFLAENIATLVSNISGDYDFILAPTTTNGKNVMPRVAALQDVSQISDISAIESSDTFQRPIYAGNCIATVKSNDTKKIITVRTTGFDAADATSGSAEILTLEEINDAGISKFVKEEIAESDRPELTAADVIISGGRGMQNGDNFSILEGIADKLGAAIGASRAAVDSGFVPNDYQVGQTGKIVAPDLYIAVGISGAIQHLAGMKDSKVIVAINKDEDAPIFQVADYGLVADLFEAMPELESKI
ncbi:MAG: electron transfer flavoprotein subunit alpha/FixB family protein [Gammaproteobacteria bacterium]|nr:MAG: electron transfer flavoprotein subunit alpha/FixB family protein [Gammaproteobacteria bacterium]